MEIKFSEQVQNALNKMPPEQQQDYVKQAVWLALNDDGYLDDKPDPRVPSVEKDGNTWTFHVGNSGAGGGRVGAKISMQEIAEANNGMPVAPVPDVHIYGGGGGYWEGRAFVTNSAGVHIDQNGQVWRAGGGHPDNPPAVGIGQGEERTEGLLPYQKQWLEQQGQGGHVRLAAPHESRRHGQYLSSKPDMTSFDGLSVEIIIDEIDKSDE